MPHTSSDTGFNLKAAPAFLYLVGRIVTAVAFMAFALGQIMGFEDVCNLIRTAGLGWAGFWCVINIALDFSGSVLLLLGFKARLGAAILCASTAFASAALLGAGANKIYVAGALAVIGGLLPYMASGPGPISFEQHHIAGTSAKRRF